MKIICDCWLMCKMRNNCTNSRIQNEFWWLSEKNLMIYRIENLNSQLMEVIDFKKYECRIGQNSSRSITRVKRIYWTFFYRLCSMNSTTRGKSQVSKIPSWEIRVFQVRCVSSSFDSMFMFIVVSSKEQCIAQAEEGFKQSSVPKMPLKRQKNPFLTTTNLVLSK